MMSSVGDSTRKVLLVDMMSGANDYGRELAFALSEFAKLTVVTVSNTPLVSGKNLLVLPIFPAFGSVGGSRWGKIGRTVMAYGRLIRELYLHRADVVHVQFFRFQWLDMLVYAMLRPLLKTLVFTAHNALPHEHSWWHLSAYRWWYRTVDRVHVLSNYARLRILGFAKLAPEHVAVVPHGNYALLERQTTGCQVPTNDSLGIPSNHLIGLIFGLVRDYKGVDRLIDAAALLPDGMPVTFVVAGGGDDKLMASYKADVAARGLEDRVKFIARYLPDDELAGLLRACDFALFPYRHIYQSGALMLALTFGCAIVASDIDGFREYVDADENAILCDTADPNAFSAAISRMVSDQDLRERLALSAKKISVERYGWGVIAADLIDFYGGQSL